MIQVLLLCGFLRWFLLFLWCLKELNRKCCFLAFFLFSPPRISLLFPIPLTIFKLPVRKKPFFCFYIETDTAMFFMVMSYLQGLSSLFPSYRGSASG